MRAEDSDRSRAEYTVPSEDWSIEAVWENEALVVPGEDGSPTLCLTTIVLIEAMRKVGLRRLTEHNSSEFWSRYVIHLNLVDGNYTDWYLTWPDVLRHEGLQVNTVEYDFIEFLKQLPWRDICSQANKEGHEFHEGRPALASEQNKSLSISKPTLDGWEPPVWPMVATNDSRLQRLQRVDAVRARTHDAVQRLAYLLAEEQVSTDRLRSATEEAESLFGHLWDEVDWLTVLLKSNSFGAAASAADESVGELEHFQHRVGRNAIVGVMRMSREDHAIAMRPFEDLDLVLGDAVRLATASIVVSQQH